MDELYRGNWKVVWLFSLFNDAFLIEYVVLVLSAVVTMDN